MAICIVVLSENGQANQLRERLQKEGITVVRCDLIKPRNANKIFTGEETKETAKDLGTSAELNPIDIDTVQLLNPNLSKRSRQKKMSMLLMPFGFIAGLTFSQMTSLTTFSDLGIGALGEPLSGGLVGMLSGWMGSHVAAATVSDKNDEDINSLRKLCEEGQWLLLIETPFEVELPWNLLKEINPVNIFRLSDQ